MTEEQAAYEKLMAAEAEEHRASSPSPEEAAIRERDASPQPLGAFDYHMASAARQWETARIFVEETAEDRHNLLRLLDDSRHERDVATDKAREWHEEYDRALAGWTDSRAKCERLQAALRDALRLIRSVNGCHGCLDQSEEDGVEYMRLSAIEGAEA